MALILKQIGALVRKDIALVLNRRSFYFTLWRALWIPIIFSIYMSFILRVYWPKETYGIGSPTPIRTLNDAMNTATGGRNTLVFVNSINSGGDIDKVIQLIAEPVQAAGKTVKIFNNYTNLVETCRSTLQGTTKCYGAVVFNSSPKEGPDGVWNYTLKADATFGTNIYVQKTNNDAEIYQLPLQRAVDIAIATVNVSGTASALPAQVDEYPFTSMTEKQWKDKIVLDIQDATFHYLAVVWYIGFVGVMYQLVGLMAKEREHGMSDLVESMMPNVRRSEPQLARLIAHHLAFTIVYGPGWVIMGIIAKIGIFPKTSGGIVVIFFILNGLALVSCSIFGASFFRKSQLSGISCVVIALGLGIAAQIEAKTMTSGTVAVLGLLFTPMNFVFLLIFISRWEWNVLPANLTKPAPGSPWALRGIVLMIFLIIQIFAYPLIAVYVERWLYGTASRRSRRNVSWADGGNETPIRLNAFRKVYQQNAFLRFCSSLLGHKPSPVVAVDDLSLTALRGQILVLVGPNGCGKTTILNSIAGLNSITGGSIDIDGSNGIGICPQKNVLWNGLTVEQHAEVFYDLKTTTTSATKKEDINKLIALCGLEEKRNSPARTLSGGQKRKLQLIMMLTGGSRVCCVDEVSGGLDPLSRRRVWDILLAERGTRTFIITTHFLDEAEYLADHMVIMSRGQVKGEGSTSELKARLGNGYRFSVPPGIESLNETALVGIRSKLHAEQTFATTDPAVALEQIKRYKAEGINNYQIAGPTIEEVFMKLEGDQEDVAGVEELPIHDDSSNHNGLSAHPEKGAVVTTADEKQHEATLLTGHRTGAIKQAFILFQKRLKVLRWNWFTYLATICIPVVAAGLMTLILKHFQNPGCDYLQQVSISDIQTLSQNLQPELVAGPPSAFNAQNLALFLPSVTGVDQTLNASTLPGALTMVNTFSEFTNLINSNFSTVDPGGIFLGGNGTVPTLSYRGDIGTLALYSAIFLQNAIDVFLSNQTIVTQYSVFDFPWPENTSDSLQFIFYFGLVMSAYPAFFALYPTIERLRGVRALQYSNGVRSLPLWLAYLVFDGIIVLVISVFITAVFGVAVPAAWWNLTFIWLCLFLYGLASILLSYVISLIAKSQLSAFAFSAGGQAFMLLMYMTAYMQTNVNAPPDKVPSQLLLIHFTLGLITPIGQLTRALIVGMNLFSTLCVGLPPTKATNPGAIKLYGGPIIYLIGQSLFLFGILVWHDHGFSFFFKRKDSQQEYNLEDTTTHEPEVSEEIARASRENDGLRVLHISKSFRTLTYGKVNAIEDLTFGVKPGEVFALVGPNGAGKSTTITLLRGEIKPNRSPPGRILIQNLSLSTSRSLARQHLGVCPQHDAMDQMTVSEHLRFYASIRGVHNISRNVSNLISAVGLGPFENRMGSKLSGGNKRKLSLAIALIGNPEVLLLDEPSSGMDPLAKRNMWKTLSRFVPHRSILLTTHSMEEADALADRVGVLAKHMLDVGTTAHLRQKHGHGFHIHLVLASAPQTTQEEAARVQGWIEEHLPGAVMERQCYHGQMRFNVPSSIPAASPSTSPNSPNSSSTSPPSKSAPTEEAITVGSIFLLLESNKTPLGLAFHSVSPSTFDEVFLKVVEKHGVSEEDLGTNRRAVSAGDIAMFIIFPPLFLYRWAKGRQDAELQQQNQGVRGVLPEREVGQGSGVVGDGAPEARQGEVGGGGTQGEEVVFPNREVTAPSTGFSLWPPPIYVLVRNFIRRRRGQ